MSIVPVVTRFDLDELAAELADAADKQWAWLDGERRNFYRDLAFTAARFFEERTPKPQAKPVGGESDTYTYDEITTAVETIAGHGPLATWLWAELMEALEADAAGVGWRPSPEPDPDHDMERDITKDVCRACGRERGSVDEVEIDGAPCNVTELPDPCLGLLPGVGQACCGHGYSGDAVYLNQLRGPEAAHKMRELGGNPPAAAFQPVRDETPAA
jgi:hypothetical protein